MKMSAGTDVACFLKIALIVICHNGYGLTLGTQGTDCNTQQPLTPSVASSSCKNEAESDQREQNEHCICTAIRVISAY